MTQTYDANAAHQNAWARLVDENGNPPSIGGGTEYTEDAAAAANPAGKALILVRRDTLATNEVSADGDNVAAKATSKGQLHVYAEQIPAALGSGGGLKVEGVTDDYETVAPSQTDQVLGATGASGDYLAGVLIVPATTSPGAVSIKDGAGSAITIFTGGASSVSNLVPFFVPLGIKSTSGAWKVTTGANVSAIGAGNFT